MSAMRAKQEKAFSVAKKKLYIKRGKFFTMRHHNGPKSDMIMYCYCVVLRFSLLFNSSLSRIGTHRNFNSSHKHGLHTQHRATNNSHRHRQRLRSEKARGRERKFFLPSCHPLVASGATALLRYTCLCHTYIYKIHNVDIFVVVAVRKKRRENEAKNEGREGGSGV